MSNNNDGSVPEAARAVYNHLLHHKPAEAIGFLFSQRLSSALEVTVRDHVSPTASVEELRRLLAIKAFMGDTDGIKLEPTLFMDELWKAIIVDTRLYSDLQEALGLTLHRPMYHAENDTAEKHELRLKTLRSLYTSVFESQPLVATVSVPQPSNVISASSAVRTNLENNNSQDEGPITFRLVNHVGHEISVKVKRSIKVSKIYELQSERNGMAPSAFALFHDGTRMVHQNCLSDYGVHEGDIVKCVIEQRGC